MKTHESMNIKSNLLHLATLVILMCGTDYAKAQNASGFACNNDNNVITELVDFETGVAEITLGNDANWNCEGCQFTWEAIDSDLDLDEIIFDVHSPNPTVTLPVSTTTFKVTRASKYGYQDEIVVVIVKDEIEIKDAQPQKTCFQRESVLHPYDFIFTTDPPGHGDLVDIADEDKELKRDHWDFFGNEIVHFKVKRADGTYENSDYTTTIYVPTGDWPDYSISLNNIIDAPENWKEIKNAFHSFKTIKQKTEELKKAEGLIKKFIKTPCEKDMGFDWTMSLSINMDCCNDKKIALLHLNGGVNGHVGIGVVAPIFPPVPGIGLMATIGMEIGFDLSGDLNLSTDGYCASLEIPITLYGDISLGLAVAAVDPDVLGVTCKGTGGIYGDLLFKDIGNGFRFKYIDAYAKCQLSVEISFIAFNKEFIICESDPIYFSDPTP